MTQERVSMRNTKEVLRLFYDLKLSKRQVARSCNIAPSTVREYLRKVIFPGDGRRLKRLPRRSGSHPSSARHKYSGAPRKGITVNRWFE
jgi:hypothetical protein